MAGAGTDPGPFDSEVGLAILPIRPQGGLISSQEQASSGIFLIFRFVQRFLCISLLHIYWW